MLNYYLRDGDAFRCIQSYEVEEHFLAGETVYKENLVDVVSNLEDEELKPRRISGIILGETETYVRV